MASKKYFVTAALALLTAGAAVAQDNTQGALKSYSYVEAQGGVQLTATDASMTKLMTPTVAVSLGHYFTPAVGARLHVNAWQSKSGFSATDQFYKWKYITPDLDLLVNLTNLITKTSSHPLNVIFVGGLGLNYAWDNDEFKALNVSPQDAPLAWDENRLSHNLRAGLRLETDVTKPLGLSLEVNANSTSDRFNSKTNDQDDWQFTAMLGVSYRFGRRYQKCCAAPAPVAQEVVEVVPAVPVVVEKPEPKQVVKTESLHEEIFYVICKSDPTESGTEQLKRVVEYQKKFPEAKIYIVGYADKGTGNPEINQMYAERRAAQCKDALVNIYGCNAAQIVIDSKGDTVQPFAENDKNRCVIIDAKTQVTVTE